MSKKGGSSHYIQASENGEHKKSNNDLEEELIGTPNPFFQPASGSLGSNLTNDKHQAQEETELPVIIVNGNDNRAKFISSTSEESETKRRPLLLCSFCYAFLASVTTGASLFGFFFSYIPIENDFRQDNFDFYMEFYTENDIEIDIGSESVFHLLTDFIIFLVLSLMSCCVVIVPCKYQRGKLSGGLFLALTCLFMLMLPIQVGTIAYSRTMDLEVTFERYENTNFFLRSNLCQFFQDIADNGRTEVTGNYITGIFDGEDYLSDTTLPMCVTSEVLSFIGLFSNFFTIIVGIYLGYSDLKPTIEAL